MPMIVTRLRVVSLLLLLVLCLAILPATAQTLYSNGPIDGTTNAWLLNFGMIVSNSFTVDGNGATVTGMSFGAWLFPGDVLDSAEVSITSSEFGGTTYYDQRLSFAQSGCAINQLGFNICVETTIGFGDVNLPAGNYWLNLQNAQVATNEPIYWDENSGPSSASQNSVGTIPSEAFTILGTPTSTGTTGTVPEPGSIILLGSGALTLVGVLRRAC